MGIDKITFIPMSLAILLIGQILYRFLIGYNLENKYESDEMREYLYSICFHVRFLSQRRNKCACMMLMLL